jgi:hypothetical protein
MTTKPRLDRARLAWPPPPRAVRQLSTKPGAVRVREHLQRRKAGIHCLTVQMSEPDLQSLAKLPPQADPAVERTIGAVLNAAYRTPSRDREHLATSSEAPDAGESRCDYCGAAGVVGYFPGSLQPAQIRGERCLAHSRCFEALCAARGA